jgi:hypothetical protein
MTASRVLWFVRRASGRVVAIAAVLLVLGRSAPARADNVDELIQQLAGDDSDKIRLSAALNLTKLGNQRAIKPLARALIDDSDRSVRGAAAVGLGALVNDRTRSDDRQEAIRALKRAAGDSSDFVKSQADKALRAIDGGATTPPPSAGGIYVNIGPMSSKTGDSGADGKLQALMVRIATKTMGKARNMATSWPGGVPTKAVLDAKGTLGFYVDGTLNELKVKEGGSTATVSCRINMLLASYPDRSIFALLNGGASVQASGSGKDIALAREDCVSAVVEDLIAKKIVPTINIKAGAQ